MAGGCGAEPRASQYAEQQGGKDREEGLNGKRKSASKQGRDTACRVRKKSGLGITSPSVALGSAPLR